MIWDKNTSPFLCLDQLIKKQAPGFGILLYMVFVVCQDILSYFENKFNSFYKQT